MLFGYDSRTRNSSINNVNVQFCFQIQFGIFLFNSNCDLDQQQKQGIGMKETLPRSQGLNKQCYAQTEVVIET